MDGRNIVIFDGVCNLCNSSVRFLIKLDKHKILSFSHLQTEFSKKLLSELAVNFSTIDSVALLADGHVYYKSEAVLKIFEILGYPWRLLALFKILPVAFLDVLYDFIARNRYKWFGRHEKCLIPDGELLKRFIE